MKAMKNIHFSHKESNEELSSNIIDIMQFYLKLLCIAGIRATDEIKTQMWKLVLYRLYQTLLYLLHIPLIISQIFALIHYWDNLIVILEICQTFGFVLLSFVTPLLFRWSDAYKIVYNYEIKSNFKKSTYKTQNKRAKIFKNTTDTTNLLNKITYIYISNVAIVWSLQPFIYKFIENVIQKEDVPSNLTTKLFPNAPLNTFPMVVYSPLDLTVNPAYILMYGFIVFNVVIMSIKSCAMVPVISNLIFFISTQFKTVITTLETIDELVDTEPESAKEHTSKNPHYVSTATELQLQVFTHSAQNGHFTRKSVDINKSSEENTANNYYTNKHELTIDPENEALVTECLVDAIKQQQAIIKLLEETNTLCTWFFLYFRVLMIYMYALAVFLLSQSLSINAVSYKLSWYNRSTKFKKILCMFIMRSQISCTLAAGPWAKVTLEELGNVLSASYTYFTLLLQIHHD